MKTYIKPVIKVIEEQCEYELMTVSGTDEVLQSTSNGDYSESGGIVLGARESLWDFED